jgi:hypothetical protein
MRRHRNARAFSTAKEEIFDALAIGPSVKELICGSQLWSFVIFVPERMVFTPRRRRLPQRWACFPLSTREGPTELRFERGDISGDRDDVVVGKLLDHALHQHGPGASALAGRHEVELPRDVHGRLTREAWHLGEAI